MSTNFLYSAGNTAKKWFTFLSVINLCYNNLQRDIFLRNYETTYLVLLFISYKENKLTGENQEFTPCKFLKDHAVFWNWNLWNTFKNIFRMHSITDWTYKPSSSPTRQRILKSQSGLLSAPQKPNVNQANLVTKLVDIISFLKRVQKPCSI